jgi:hypothetical protein
MDGKIIVLHANGARETRPVVDASEPAMLTALHDIVGGYIEAVPFFKDIEIDGAIRPCLVFCNEEGKLHEHPFNYVATVAWDASLRRNGYPSGEQHQRRDAAADRQADAESRGDLGKAQGRGR